MSVRDHVSVRVGLVHGALSHLWKDVPTRYALVVVTVAHT